jgi:hypothetical protein
LIASNKIKQNSPHKIIWKISKLKTLKTRRKAFLKKNKQQALQKQIKGHSQRKRKKLKMMLKRIKKTKIRNPKQTQTENQKIRKIKITKQTSFQGKY